MPRNPKECAHCGVTFQPSHRAADDLGTKLCKKCRREGMVPRWSTVERDETGAIRKTWDRVAPPAMEPEERVQIPGAVPVAVSTCYNEEGKVVQQWVKEKPEEAERWAAISEAVAGLVARVEPLPEIREPHGFEADVMVGYPVGDHHIGMLAWGVETGEKWDIRIAEEVLAQSIDNLVARSPQSQRAVVAFLGDFMHYDNTIATTPSNGNPLDSDGRYPKMIRASIESMSRTIERAAERHAEVNVVIEIGNHDLFSSIFLQETMRALYKANPRVHIDTSPRHFHFIEFGSNLIATHHGHGVKMDRLPGVLAADAPEAWGRTKHRVWWTGHIHHQQIHEYPGCTVESFRVLAPKDAWHHQHGYRSERDMKSIVFHREHGEVSRLTVNPGMFR